MDRKLLVVSRTLVPIALNKNNNGSAGNNTRTSTSGCALCESNLKLVERCKEELSRRAKEDAGRLEAWNAMRGELESRLNELESSSAKRVMDAVVEIEGHKSRAARAERERDALQFQLQEVERRHRADRDEELGIRETLNSRVSDFERRTNIIELQRSRAETEASAARQQLEYWRSSARAAQDEVAALRTHVEQLRAGRLSAVVPPPQQQQQQLHLHGAEPSWSTASDVSPKPTAARAVAAGAANADKETAEKIRVLEAEARQLSEALDDIGPAKTLKTRLVREQMRRKMQELRDQVGRLRETLAATR